MVDPQAVLHQLLHDVPARLNTLAEGQGIYALYDDEGEPRYIGFTARCLKDRIFKRHVGGDGNSHKFSTIYNAGRMFHTRGHRSTCSKDGPVAKELRRLFVREYCRAVAIPLPGLSEDELRVLEGSVLSLAPAEAKRWNHARALDPIEPTEKLSAFLTVLDWSSDKFDAIERQAQRWKMRAI